MPCQCTTTVAIASVLLILLALVVVIFTTVIIVVCIRSKKQVLKESNVYYDTINIGHHSEQPSVIETEVNVAYDHVEYLKLYLKLILIITYVPCSYRGSVLVDSRIQECSALSRF